eukprot:13976687-Alexandrium_andersonii.AAC.1
MSASLVGSGDVYKRQGGGSPPGEERRNPQKPQKTAFCSFLQRSALLHSVSYTHLTLPTICSV